jgi:integrase
VVQSSFILWVALRVEMARTIHQLNDMEISRLKETGRHHAGAGLYIQIAPTGSKSWIYRYMLDGKARQMGLGPYPEVRLAKARAQVAKYRTTKREGVDPIKARQDNLVQLRLQAARGMTFEQCATAYIEAHGAEWRNAKHREQWGSTLRTYAYPIIGVVPIQQVDIDLVLRVLQPIWATKTETARRLRSRIEAVIDSATAMGRRQGDNPARWRGHLQTLLAAPSRVRKVEHHPALAHAEIAEFIFSLRRQGGIGARALEFLILTAARTNEVLGARWAEFNLGARHWTIPAERMKAHREHRVPLSRRSCSVLSEVRKQSTGEFVFPGGKADRPLSNMALLALLHRMGRDDITVHGFRSTFRDWAAEETNYPREVAEHALAHSLPDRVEGAYYRSDLFDRRKKMMAAWAAYCSAKPSKLVSRGRK